MFTFGEDNIYRTFVDSTDANNVISYIGYASFEDYASFDSTEDAENASIWKIRKDLKITDGTEIETKRFMPEDGDGVLTNSFKFSWTDRDTYTYR